VHWDALDARSEKNTNAKALGGKAAASHATRMHKLYVREAVAKRPKLFRATPNDKKLCFVKEEVFGITDGGPIIGPDYPVMLEMFAQSITGSLGCSNLHQSIPILSLDAGPLTSARGWQAITKPRFVRASGF
jgi:hypothetical protein